MSSDFKILWIGLSLFLGPAYAGMLEDVTQGPCAADYQSHCAETTPGQGRLLKCLNEHVTELSEACRHWGRFGEKAWYEAGITGGRFKMAPPRPKCTRRHILMFGAAACVEE